MVTVTVAAVVPPTLPDGTVPVNEPVATWVPKPVIDGVKVPVKVPAAVQADEGVIVAVVIVVTSDVTGVDAYAKVSVPAVVAVPPLVTAPENAEADEKPVPAKVAASIQFEGV